MDGFTIKSGKILKDGKEVDFKEFVSYCKLHPDKYTVEENTHEDIYVMDDERNVKIENRVCTKITIK
jgi:Mlc titration factor MtfA (ptsG expression regulator)